MSAGYAGKDIQDPQAAVDDVILTWIQHLRKQRSSVPGQARGFDIGRRIQFLTVDVTTKLCLGESFGCIEADRDQHAFLETVKDATPISLQLSLFPELTKMMYHLAKLTPLRRFLVPSAADIGGIGTVMGVCLTSKATPHMVYIDRLQVVKNAISDRIGASTTPRDMLESFLSRGLSRDQAETELIVSLVAGSDTTSTAIQATLLSIITNPRVYHQLQSEIDDAIRQGKTSVPIQEVEARQLPYLQACIQEGLRIHPPLAQLRDRVAPPEGDYIHGYRIPGGTWIGFNSWGTQRDAIYGDDPDIFRPERWLEEDESRVKEMKRTCDLVFGYGPTKCLGSNIAGLILNKAIFEVWSPTFGGSATTDGIQILREFEVTVAHPLRPWKSQCWGIFFQEEFNVCMTRREVSR
ncbi:MAG: hypothetical protein Q9168_001483 [Polycauliona sp. 1 TL-2023]